MRRVSPWASSTSTAPHDHSHIFLENAQQALHLPPDQQRTAALLDLNYYLPCRVQDGATTRTIAVIGLGRTIGGDFLSSEDVELLESLASYIGIALQNASLYARLEEQDQRVRAAQGIQREHRRIHQRRHPGHRSRRPHRKLERADGSHVRPQPQRSPRPGSAVPSSPRSLSTRSNSSATSRAYTTSTSSGSPRAPASSAPSTSPSRRCSRATLSPWAASSWSTTSPSASRSKTQLAQADKLSSIGLLAAGVAHEINTPLAVISSYAQMLSKQMRGDARLGPVLEKITQQSFRAAEIANGLLNFSRTSTTEFRETNLNQVIRDTLSLLEHQFKTAQIIVDTRPRRRICPPSRATPASCSRSFSICC